MQSISFLTGSIKYHKTLLNNKVTSMRAPITFEEYLSVPLRFLATRESYSSLAIQFGISASTLC